MIVKTPEELRLIREACKITKQALDYSETLVRPGITTIEIDEKVSQFIHSKGATPASKGYYGYPANICTSVNEVVNHGIPNNTVLKEGDIISIDITVRYKGYNGDAARTFPVGKVSEQKKRLIDVTKQSFFEAIKDLKAGDRIGKISHTIQTYVEFFGYSVVRELVGHGIGKNMHENPNVPNFGQINDGPIIKENICLAIEPIINMGKKEILLLGDGWTIITKDGLPSAHYENTVLITEKGVEILTI